MDHLDYLIKTINNNSVSKHKAKNVEDAKFYHAIYSGKDQKDIVNKYRLLESKKQQNQRDRVTISRTKHVSKQIERCFNHLRTLDKSAKVIEGGKDAQKLKDYVYENNIEKIAFEYVSYYNLTDANAFLICNVDEFENIVFSPVKSTNVVDYKIVNDNLVFLIVERQNTVNKKVYKSYSMFTQNEVINLEHEATGKLISDQTKTIKGNRFYVTKVSTKHCYAFRLGYTKNVETDFETCNTILDSASELYKALIWEGSELDVIKLTHGIIQKFAYAQRCNYTFQDDNGFRACSDGRLDDNSTCPKCKGTGLKIHHSSQDIVFLEEPLDNESRIPLDQQIHVEYIPDSILEYRTNEIENLETKIVKTVFSSNYLTKSEVAVTATEKRIDQQGLYSALGQMGVHVSDCFIWMCETIIDINDWKEIDVSHGYSLDFKLDTVETLIDLRTKASQAGVPIEVIHVIDYAIQSKQHIDNPKAIERIAFWEQFRPFTDKTENEKMQILAGLRPKDPIKILWSYFGYIKQQVIGIHEDAFYSFKFEKQKQIIDDAVQAIIDKIASNESNITDFTGLQ